jgi:PncC family amidohydrolase
MGGVIAYDNRIKTSLLNVSPELLQQYGAVSSETVMAMAQGVRHLCGTDCALSTSGIAGPGGGSPEKPVGLVYIGVAFKETARSFEYRFSGDRTRIREETVQASIARLLEMIS